MSLAYSLPTTFVGILFCRCYTIGLTSKVAGMCGGTCKQFRSNSGNAGGDPSTSPRRDGMDRVRAAKVSEVVADGILITRRDAVDTDDDSGVTVDVSRYAGVSYQIPETQLVRLAQEVALELALRIAGCHWDSVDVMDYV